MVKLDYARLKNIRLEQDITQKELATATGVNLSTIKQIETGRSATDLENIEKLCAYLEVDINEIYHPDYHDTKVLCMLNNKGGCGKTSLCSGIATSMAELGLRILVIDGDGQRNLSSSFDMPRSEKNFGAAVLAEQDLNGYIQPTKFENIDIIVADVSMGTLDMALFTKISRENIVRSIPAPRCRAAGYYDYILIDTNPNLSLLNFNIVNASNYVLIPAQPASFDLDGLAVVLQFVEGIKPYNPTLQVGGIIINRYDARNRLITEAAMDQLRESYSALLFEQIIRVDSRLQNAQWENRPVLGLRWQCAYFEGIPRTDQRNFEALRLRKAVILYGFKKTNRRLPRCRCGVSPLFNGRAARHTAAGGSAAGQALPCPG